jgi:RNA ligase (TIGR02306 family)
MSEYKRKLASVQEIDTISEHGNADSLEMVAVKGWSCVVKKGDFKKGQIIIYLEIDSVCPVKPWSDLLKKYKYRVKTIRLRGKLSQGLVLPFDILSETKCAIDDLKIGDDVTDLLGITKYESPEELKHYQPQKTKEIRGATVPTLPTQYGFSKTDEPRIQSEPEFLAQFKGKKWYSTIKVNGTSFTGLISPESGEPLICSRNLIVPKPDDVEKSKNVYWIVAIKYGLTETLKKFPHLAIQGEIYGPNILGNNLEVDELKLAIFSVYDMNKKRYCSMPELIDNCAQMGLEMVEIESKGDSFDFTLAELLEKAKGNYRGTQNPREGLVIRLQDEVYMDKSCWRASFKVISNDFSEREK